MDAGIKQKWLERLRSGEIVQGTGRLRKEDQSRCCLGVLCDIAESEGVGSWTRVDAYGPEKWAFGIGGEDLSEGCLPVGVAKWAGFDLQKDGLNGTLEGNDCLASMNDNFESFETIADVIEANF